MAASSGMSFVLSFCLLVLLFAFMQVYRIQLASSKVMTIVGGYLGSVIFVLALTAIGNFEAKFFGKGFQTKLLPEVGISLLVALFASGLIHRVCVTICFLFSIVALYYMNKISHKTYSQSASATPIVAGHTKAKRK